MNFSRSLRGEYKSCEQEYYFQHSISTLDWLAEPVSALSALGMCVLAIYAPPLHSWKTELPAVFWLAQAALFGNGIGSFFWHGVSAQTTASLALPTRMLDGLTMTMLAGFTALLFFDQLSQSTILYAYMTVLWFMVSGFTNDSTAFAFLYYYLGDNAPLLLQFAPILFVYILMLYTILITHSWEQCCPFVGILASGLAAWFIDRYACSGVDVFSFGHCLWHLCMGYASLLFICYALERRGYILVGRWYPELEQYKDLDKETSSC